MSKLRWNGPDLLLDGELVGRVVPFDASQWQFTTADLESRIMPGGLYKSEKAARRACRIYLAQLNPALIKTMPTEAKT